MRHRLIAALITAAAGLAFGYHLGAPDPAPAAAKSVTRTLSAIPSVSKVDAAREFETVWKGEKASEHFLLATTLSNIHDPAKIRDLLEQTHLLPPNVSQGTARGILLRNWIETDPEAAVHWTIKNATRHTTTLLETWANADPAAALAHARDAPRSYGPKLAGAVLGTVSLDDPEQAQQLLIELAPQLAGNIFYAQTALRRIADHDPTAALEFAESLSGDLRDELRQSVASVMLKADFASAANWWQAQPDRGSLGDAMFRHAAPEHWGASLDLMLQHEAGGISYSLTYAWAQKDPALVTTLLAEREGIRSYLVTNSFNRWRRTDRDAATAWAAGVTDEDLKRRLDAALAQTESPTGASIPTTAAEAVTSESNHYYGIAHLSPEERARLPEELANLPADQAMQALSSLTRNDELVHLIDLPALYAAIPHTDDFDADPIKEAIHDYAMASPAEAARWAEQFPPGPAQNAAVQQAASTWYDYDPTAARAWAESLTDQSARSAALESLE